MYRHFIWNFPPFPAFKRPAHQDFTLSYTLSCFDSQFACVPSQMSKKLKKWGVSLILELYRFLTVNFNCYYYNNSSCIYCVNAFQYLIFKNHNITKSRCIQLFTGGGNLKSFLGKHKNIYNVYKRKVVFLVPLVRWNNWTELTISDSKRLKRKIPKDQT